MTRVAVAPVDPARQQPVGSAPVVLRRAVLALVARLLAELELSEQVARAQSAVARSVRPNLQGQKCSALSTNVPAETACIQGQCCSLVDACLADAACSSFVACGSNCLQTGGTPQSCGQQCASCLGASQSLYTAFTSCVQACASGDGGTADGGASDAATD